MKPNPWSLGVIGLCLLAVVVQSVRLAARDRSAREQQARLEQAESATRSAREALSAAQAELTQLRADGEALRLEVAELRGRLNSAARQTASASNPGPGDAAPAGRRNLRERGAFGPPAGRQDTLMRGVVDGRLNLIRERLNLSPEQEEGVRAAMDEALRTGLEHLRRLRDGEATYDDVPTLQEWTKALEDQILAGLTPEQQAAYEQYRQAEQQGNARMAANTELLLVQGSLGLSPEQQDAMFSVLYDQSLRGMDTDPQAHVGRPRDPVAALDWEAAQKRQALQGVLTPAQMANYERLQNSYRDMVGRFLRPPGSGGNARPPSP
jgi:hypothetical protein